MNVFWNLLSLVLAIMSLYKLAGSLPRIKHCMTKEMRKKNNTQIFTAIALILAIAIIQVSK